MRFILYLILVFLSAAVRAAIPVVDLSVLAQATEQVLLTTKQLKQATEELERLGDPAKVVISAGKDLVRELAREGKGKVLEEVHEAADGFAGVLSDGNGLYRIPGARINLPNGSQVPRDLTGYRKFSAVDEAIRAQEEVFKDTEERRRRLRSQIASAIRDLQRASTMAEIAKIQAVLTAQSAELAAIDRERDAASARVLSQHVANETDAARQEQARREERREALRQAGDRLGTWLVPSSTPASIPDPQRR